MIKKSAIAFILLSILARLCFSQENPDNERLRNLVRQNRQAEVAIPHPGFPEIDVVSRNVSVRSVREKTVYLVLSPLTIDWFLDRGYDYTIVENGQSKAISGSTNMIQAMEWETYPTYTQYDSIMRYFASTYPSLCRLATIGTSIKGMNVMALKISDNCGQDETEPEVFYTSSLHGDETGGFILMLRLAGYLLMNYGANRQVTDIVDNLEIWINPLANPDGTYNNGNSIDAPVRNNYNNYDLNRNFPDPESPNTVKQKETLDMMKFLAGHRFVLSANFHSGEEVVNYPWDRWSRDHADKSWFYAISRAYADTVHLHAPSGYMDYLDNGVTNGYDWYPIYGGRQDYTTWELQGREVTIELDNDYITPEEELNALWEYNYRSLLGFLENAMRGISGLVTDAKNGQPVPAKIFIDGHDRDNSHVYSDTVTGEYTRLLEPGTWDLTFTAAGYQERVISNLVLAAGEGISLDVEMEPVLSPVDTTNPEKPLLYPNPGTTFIKAVLPENLRGTINIKIFSPAGVKLSDYNTVSFPGNPVLIDTRWLAPGSYIVVFTGAGTGISYRGRIIVAGE